MATSHRAKVSGPAQLQWSACAGHRSRIKVCPGSGALGEREPVTTMHLAGAGIACERAPRCGSKNSPEMGPWPVRGREWQPTAGKNDRAVPGPLGGGFSPGQAAGCATATPADPPRGSGVRCPSTRGPCPADHHRPVRGCAKPRGVAASSSASQFNRKPDHHQSKP